MNLTNRKERWNKKMNTDKFNTLTEKLYPDKLDREDAKLACEMIVTTEQLINAKKNYNDTKKEIKTYLEEHNSNFPGHFLIPIDKIKLDKLRELINFTFDETKRSIYTYKEKEMLRPR